MKIIYTGFAFLLIFITPFYGFGFQNVTANDTLQVIKYNNRAFELRKAKPDQTVAYAKKALDIATQLKYANGIAESYRTMGIGYAYQFDRKSAFDQYLNALNAFSDNRNEAGVAKVNMNIGNLFRDNDYDKALDYFNEALTTGVKINDKKLIASLYLNIGNIYVRKKNFDLALQKINQSRKMFEALKDTSNLISCDQNAGVSYYGLRQYDVAKTYLVRANARAKQLKDMNSVIAGIDLTLADVSVAQNQFAEAEKYIKEGKENAHFERIQSDFDYTTYQLELKRKNYKEALTMLTSIFKQDSIENIQVANDNAGISQKIFNNEINLAKQKISRYLFWGATIGSGLALVVIILLIMNVRRKVKTNLRLTELNSEVSRQKDNLDRINHHLEEIIDERTKDLQVKNKKLSEYSSYLSHQIRGPIATLKGLMNLEKEGLVDKKECISMMNKCVSEIDDKIIDMSDMLHDPDRAGF